MLKVPDKHGRKLERPTCGPVRTRTESGTGPEPSRAEQNRAGEPSRDGNVPQPLLVQNTHTSELLQSGSELTDQSLTGHVETFVRPEPES